jgi:hypothetical protein
MRASRCIGTWVHDSLPNVELTSAGETIAGKGKRIARKRPIGQPKPYLKNASVLLVGGGGVRIGASVEVDAEW